MLLRQFFQLGINVRPVEQGSRRVRWVGGWVVVMIDIVSYGSPTQVIRSCMSLRGRSVFSNSVMYTL